MFCDHNLLRTLALSRPYVSLKEKDIFHLPAQIFSAVAAEMYAAVRVLP